MKRQIDLQKLNIAEIDAYLSVSIPEDYVEFVNNTAIEIYTKNSECNWVEYKTDAVINSLELAVMIARDEYNDNIYLNTNVYCISIGYIGNDSLWPVANPWKKPDPMQGNVLVQISDKEFTKNILNAVYALDNMVPVDGNLVTIVLNAYSNVNAKQLMQAIAAISDCGFTDIKLMSGEMYSRIFSISNEVEIPDAKNGGLTQ